MNDADDFVSGVYAFANGPKGKKTTHNRTPKNKQKRHQQSAIRSSPRHKNKKNQLNDADDYVCGVHAFANTPKGKETTPNKTPKNKRKRNNESIDLEKQSASKQKRHQQSAIRSSPRYKNKNQQSTNTSIEDAHDSGSDALHNAGTNSTSSSSSTSKTPTHKRYRNSESIDQQSASKKKKTVQKTQKTDILTNNPRWVVTKGQLADRASCKFPHCTVLGAIREDTDR
jgi:hypothetical protein